MDAETGRLYRRGSHFQGEAKVSRDNGRWSAVEIMDLSSNGMMFKSGNAYDMGDELWMDVTIYGLLSQFEFKCKGSVRNRKEYDGYSLCGVEFIGLDKDKKIVIDENVMRDRPVSRATYDPD